MIGATVNLAAAWVPADPVMSELAERVHLLLSVRPRTTTEIARLLDASIFGVLDVLRDGLTTGEIVELPGLRYVLDDVWEGPQ